MTHSSKYFYGHEISAYGQENGYVDYRTLAQAFNHVMNNDIMQNLEQQGFYFDQISGFVEIDDDEEYANYAPDIFQTFIIDENGAEILKEADEIVYYNESLDMYLWGVTHWGTSWDYVLTNIKLDIAA